MSEAAEVPRWTLGWRLQRSLAWGGISVEEMAMELDVSRSTISRWCHDLGAPPRSIYLRAWADKCRVPLDWLTGSNRTATMRDPSPDIRSDICDQPHRPPSTAEVKALMKRIPLTRPAPHAAQMGIRS